MLSVNATYAHTSGDSLMRGLNLNPPVDGVRPDPTFANIVQVLGDAESRAEHAEHRRQHQLQLPPTPAARPMINGGPA